ncbi:DUF6069 family protein [Kribbella sp. NPDC054772]
MTGSTVGVVGRTAHPVRGLVVTGVIATLATMLTVTLGAALAQAVGADFQIPDGGETIPLAGFAVVTGFFSLIGVLLAVALLRWSARPAVPFVWTTVALTTISLVPPLVSGAEVATIAALLALHLVAAGVMISTLTTSLRRANRDGGRGAP